MRILYMANGHRGVACLKALIENGENIVGVVGHPEALKEVAKDSVKELALRHNLSFTQPRNVNSPDSLKDIASLKPDLIIMSGYNQILSKEILNIPPLGCLNLHGGKLPDYRGVAPLNWAIINDESRIGLSILLADEGIDTGDVVAECEFEIFLEDTIADVIDKTLEIFPGMLLDVIKNVKRGTIKRKPQKKSEGNYYTRRYPRDGRIWWANLTAHQVYNLIRALTHPYPGAFTFWEGKKIYIWKAFLLEETIKGMAGRVCLRKEQGTVVIAKDKGLLLEIAQIEGDKEKRANEVFSKLGVDLT